MQVYGHLSLFLFFIFFFLPVLHGATNLTLLHSEWPKLYDYLLVCLPSDSLSTLKDRGNGQVNVVVSMPKSPANLDNCRAKACCACSRYEWWLFGYFFFYLSYLFSLSLSLGDSTLETEKPSHRAINQTKKKKLT